jgi:hypothetical protein
MAIEYSRNFVPYGAAIKRLSHGKRKRKLAAYAPFIKMWMIPGLGMRDA